MFLSSILHTCAHHLHESPTTKFPNQEWYREKRVHYITPTRFPYINKSQLTIARDEAQKRGPPSSAKIKYFDLEVEAAVIERDRVACSNCGSFYRLMSSVFSIEIALGQSRFDPADINLLIYLTLIRLLSNTNKTDFSLSLQNVGDIVFAGKCTSPPAASRRPRIVV